MAANRNFGTYIGSPYFEAINRYLDSFKDKALPEHACMLGALAEFVAEAMADGVDGKARKN